MQGEASAFLHPRKIHGIHTGRKYSIVISTWEKTGFTKRGRSSTTDRFYIRTIRPFVNFPKLGSPLRRQKATRTSIRRTNLLSVFNYSKQRSGRPWFLNQVPLPLDETNSLRASARFEVTPPFMMRLHDGPANSSVLLFGFPDFPNRIIPCYPLNNINLQKQYAYAHLIPPILRFDK